MAEGFIERVQKIEHAIGSLTGSLQVGSTLAPSLTHQDQKQALLNLSTELPSVRKMLTKDIFTANQNCLEAKVDENDYTVFTYDDLEFELEIAEEGLRKKIAFVDNQVGSIQREQC